jgi:WD40 repeat protein
MRRCYLVLLGLAVVATVWAEEPAEKPILVLDTGGHTAVVKKVLFTPDAGEVITVSEDKTIRFWDATTGESLRTLRPPIGPGSVGKLFAAALSPDGNLLAVSGYCGEGTDKPIYLIALPAGSIQRRLTGHTNVIYSLAFSPNGQWLASGSADRTARLWNAATFECVQTLKGHTDDINGVAFSPDGRRLATASSDGTARLWSAATGEYKAILKGSKASVQCVAWSPDGKTLATGSSDQAIRLWDGAGTLQREFPKLGNMVQSVQFTPDSRRLLFTRGNDSKATNLSCSLLDLASGKERRFSAHNNSVLDGVLSPDGSLAATTGGDDNETFIWKPTEKGNVCPIVCRLAGRAHPAYSAAWSKDGTTITWGNSNKVQEPGANAACPLERSFHLTDLRFDQVPNNTFSRARPSRGSLSLVPSGEKAVAVVRGRETVTKLKLNDKNDTVWCFTWWSDNQAAVGSDFGLYLFDTRTGKQIRELQGHTDTVWAVAPSPDNRYLLSASGDATLRIWAPEQDEPLLQFFFAGDDWIAWTPEGYYAASPGGERLMGWQRNQDQDKLALFYPAANFHKKFYRPDVIRRVLTTGSVARALEEADRELNKVSEQVKVEQVLPPTVVITSPNRSGLQVDKAELEVRAVAVGNSRHPVTALRLLLDGRPYEGQKGLKNIIVTRPDQPQGAVNESWMVTLTAGKHRLAVQAENAASKALSDEVEVTYTPAQAATVGLPALYVLAVGISAYPGKMKLDCAANDASDLAQIWKTKSRPLFRDVQVKLLSDQEATRDEVLGGLLWLREQMTQNDVGIVSFSGHGVRDTDGSFYLAPIDIKPKNLLASGVPGDLLKKTLAGLPGRLLVFLDACHAGSLDGDKRKRVDGLTDELVRDLVSDDYGVVVFCSSTGQEYSLEDPEQGHGYFTQALLEGLSGKADYNQDGVVYLNELDLYVTERVKELSKGKQHPVTTKPTSIRSFPLSKP